MRTIKSFSVVDEFTALNSSKHIQTAGIIYSEVKKMQFYHMISKDVESVLCIVYSIWCL